MTLRLEHIAVSRDGQVVLEDVSVTFAAGEVTGLAGRNAAGKTTLLDALALLLPVDAGRMTLDGTSLESHHVAYVPGSLTFLPFVTVAEYLDAFNASRRRRGLEALDMTAWGEAFELPLDGDVSTLSAGTQQAVALVAAMSLGRPVLLADELFANLDGDRQVIAAAALRGYARTGRHVVVSLHASDLIPLACDRVHVLADGAIVRELLPSPPPDLRALLAGPELDARTAMAEQLATRS